MDASEIYSKRLNAREVIFPKENAKFIFQPQMDESNFLEEIRNWEHPPWYGITQFEEKVTLTFLENQKGLLHNLTTHFRMPVKRLTISGPCQETSKTAITLNPESNFTRREKNHSLSYWNTLTSPELLTRTWTGFTQLTLLSEKPPDGLMWSGKRLTKRQVTYRPDHLWPELWTKLARNAKLREKQKWSNEKPKLDDARRLWGIYFIDPEDEEFKKNIENCSKEIGNTNGSSYALQDMQEKQAWRDP